MNSKSYALKKHSIEELAVELNRVMEMDEADVCEEYRTDTKQEVLDDLNYELATLEDMLDGEEEPDYDEYICDGFANEQDYLKYKFG